MVGWVWKSESMLLLLVLFISSLSRLLNPLLSASTSVGADAGAAGAGAGVFKRFSIANSSSLCLHAYYSREQ